MATLYIVATPIGNLEDVTLRALRILREVDLILCEDTRVTKKLLAKYDIADKRLAHYNEKRSGITIKTLLQYLEDGKSVALVSDAGTPTISDPGAFLISKVHDASFEVVAVPGPSAVIAALSISGLPASEFLFLGFLPHKKGREKLFKEIASAKRTAVFYESPHRILKTLESLLLCLSEDRKIVVAKELTKVHEEVVSGTAKEVLDYFKDNPDKIKGEFVVIVRGK